MEGLLVSVVALLVAESCNIGLTPVIDPENKALTRSRLSHVDQNYLRADTIAAANAALITARSRIELAQMWGGGLLASVDGLRFVVPVTSINTGPSPKYYGYKRGVTWLNAVNDQVAGIGAMVVRGTPRDSLDTLDTLLNLDGGVKPEMVATDNASYSDMAFGLYKMLGFRFAPRFRDLADQRFWRADLPDGEASAAGYGPLEAVTCNKVNLKRIATHWPDMLRVAGSLITNQVRAYDLLRMFGREGHPIPLGAAFAEYGRIDKTMHLLALVDPVDDTYRRLMNRQLTVQESRHPLAPRDLPRRPRPDPPGVPRGPGGPARRPRPRPQRRRPVEHPLPGRCRRPAPRRGPRHQGRGRRPPLSAQGPAHQLPGPLPVRHRGRRPRPGPAPAAGPGRRRGRRRRGVTGDAPDLSGRSSSKRRSRADTRDR
ncbi:hypothetical protein GCM10009574_091010 [Streptomyces asiaticus]|uniref:Tn3 transposase DDE domain-containing protein n=2 Tax=Streptomyces rhizosphaericus TaxID=114699 RepID=A0ABN1R752_9ACTN